MNMSFTTEYRGIPIEFTAEVSPPEPDVGYNYPIVEGVEIITFAGVDWEDIEHLFLMDVPILDRTIPISTPGGNAIYEHCSDHARDNANFEGRV